MTRAIRAFAGRRSKWDVDGVLLPIGRPVRATVELKWRKANPTLWCVEPAAGIELEAFSAIQPDRGTRWQGRIYLMKRAKILCRDTRCGQRAARIARIDAELLLWGLGDMLRALSGHEAGIGPLEPGKWSQIVHAIINRQKAPSRPNLGRLTHLVVAEPGVVHCARA